MKGRTLRLMMMLAAAVWAGCGDDGEGGTHHHDGPPHSLMRVGSTQPGGGRLVVDETPIAFVVETACLGGSGHSCEGGIKVYSGTSPGFDGLEADAPRVPMYRLPDGVEVRMEIVRIESGTSVMISGSTLDRPGASAVVNVTPHLHNHPVWQIALPAGEHFEEHEIVFRLHASGFQSSAEISVRLKLFEDHHHDDDHDHDHDDEDHA